MTYHMCINKNVELESDSNEFKSMHDFIIDYKSVNDSINEFSSMKSANDFEIIYESTPVILHMIDRWFIVEKSIKYVMDP